MAVDMADGTTLPDGAFIDSEQVWNQMLRDGPAPGNPPALFLDRDGVIMEDKGYLGDPGGMELIAGAIETIRAANERGIPVVVVTNQGGIGLGLIDWNDFMAVQQAMLAALAAGGAHVDAVFAAPHHPRATNHLAHPDHPARKPRPGMLLRARDMLNIDLAGSWIVGDHYRDLEAGKNAGIAGGVHVLTGHGTHEGQRPKALDLADANFTVLAAPSIETAEAVVSTMVRTSGQSRP